jgi:Uma2 family endonuclease
MTLTKEPAVLAEAVVPEIQTDYELERDKPMPSRNHGVLELLIGSTLLRKYGDTHTIFTEVTLNTDPPMTPDIAVVHPKIEFDWTQDETRLSTPPLLVVEILSPSQTVTELMDKAERYFDAGVRSYWLALPTHKLIAVHNPGVEPKVFTTGPITDPASEITITIEDIFG